MNFVFARRQMLLAIFVCVVATAAAIDVPSFSPVGKGDVGFMFYNIARDSVALAHNIDEPFVYASNVKLVTSAAALHYLGGGHRFYTLFAYNDSTRTLYVRGGGQTSTVTEDFLLLAMDLAERDMQPVDTLIVDDRLFGDNRYTLSEGEEDEGDNAYLAYTGPLSLNHNTVRIAVNPTRVGEPPEVILRTPGDYIEVVNTARTVPGVRHKLEVTTEEADGHTRLLVEGEVGVERKRPIIKYKRIYHPSEQYAAALLGYIGAPDNTPVRWLTPADSVFTIDSLRTLYLASPPLREQLRQMNVWSSNMMAETLARMLGLHLFDDPDAGPRALNTFCREQLGRETALINGSGLGNGFNKLRPEDLMALLRWAWDDPMLSIDFFGCLPVWGEEGTLSKTSGFEQPGVIRAKTGALSNVAALSGVMEGASGELYLFTWVVNRFPLRGRLDRFTYRNRMMKAIWEQL